MNENGQNINTSANVGYDSASTAPRYVAPQQGGTYTQISERYGHMYANWQLQNAPTQQVSSSHFAWSRPAPDTKTHWIWNQSAGYPSVSDPTGYDSNPYASGEFLNNPARKLEEFQRSMVAARGGKNTWLDERLALSKMNNAEYSAYRQQKLAQFRGMLQGGKFEEIYEAPTLFNGNDFREYEAARLRDLEAFQDSLRKGMRSKGFLNGVVQ